MAAARLAVLSFAAGLWASQACQAAPQSAENFYKTHPTLVLGVPADAGGTYDAYTRLLARYLPKYIPGNPIAVVEDIPAAGGLALANQTFNTAPQDGSFLAMVRGSTIQDNVNGDPSAMFDGRRFAWIGNMNMEYDSCIVAKDSPVQSLSDLFRRQLIVGASGAGAQSYTFPLVYNAVLHTKFKVVTGYKSTPERVLAMQRGELMGNCGIDTSAIQATFYKAYKQGKIKILLQGAIRKDPRFAAAPNILDEARKPPDREALEYMFATLELGRPFVTAGETPKDRVALLRRAFGLAMKDPGLVAEARKMQLDIDAMTGAECEAAVQKLYSTPRYVIDRVRAILADGH
jgi:tripartite-type tricarboxylate transporter receptor subunit TctC